MTAPLLDLALPSRSADGLLRRIRAARDACRSRTPCTATTARPAIPRGRRQGRVWTAPGAGRGQCRSCGRTGVSADTSSRRPRSAQPSSPHQDDPSRTWACAYRPRCRRGLRRTARKTDPAAWRSVVSDGLSGRCGRPRSEQRSRRPPRPRDDGRRGGSRGSRRTWSSSDANGEVRQPRISTTHILRGFESTDIGMNCPDLDRLPNVRHSGCR